MKKTLIIIGIVITVGIIFIALNTRSTNGSLPFPPLSEKRHYETPKPSDEYLPYPDSVLGELASKTDSDLRAFRCTETLFRNQEGHYLFYNPTNKHYDIRLQDEAIMQQIKKIETALKPPQKFLSGRVCIVENKDTLFMYSIGEADQNSRDFNYLGTNVTTYITTISKENTGDEALQISTVASGPFFHCQIPLAITKDRHLYYHCTQVGDGNIRNWYWRLDLARGENIPLAECTYPIVGIPPKACR